MSKPWALTFSMLARTQPCVSLSEARTSVSQVWARETKIQSGERKENSQHWISKLSLASDQCTNHWLQVGLPHCSDLSSHGSHISMEQSAHQAKKSLWLP